MYVQMLHASIVIITLQLNNSSSELEVTFLKSTAFDKNEGWLQNLT